MASALEEHDGFDTSDASTLAYVSVLVALGVVMPDAAAHEIAFSVEVKGGSHLRIEAEDAEIAPELKPLVDTIAACCFQSVRLNLPLVVH